MLRYFKIYKPYGMLSQFTREAGHLSLADLDFKFPKDVYPVGRLDHDSEGLLILTNDASLNQRLLNPGNKTEKTYWVQTEGIWNDEEMKKLKDGVTINLKGLLHRTAPAKVKTMNSPPVAERIPAINYKKHPVNSWIELKITEGKNRQIRKMTAQVGHPALRLIRFAIGRVTMEGLKDGEVEEITRNHLI